MGIAIDQIRTGVSSTVYTVLGEAYTQLPYSIDVSKNRFRAGSKCFALLAARMEQTEGVMRYVTIDQEFEFLLTESFVPPKQGDQDAVGTADILLGRLEDVYKELVNTKAGAPAYVIQVYKLFAKPVEFVDSNLAVLRATFTVKYRVAL